MGFLWASPRVFKVSFRIQTGENKSKRKEQNKEAVKTGSSEAEEHDVEQQKRMTQEKKT